MPHSMPIANLKRLVMPLIIFSCITNLAILISPIFMMQVLDRVVPSGNLSTLAMLLMLALGALLIQSSVETFRDITLGRSARWAEALGTKHALKHPVAEREAILNDTGTLSGFLRTSQAVTALNIPWIPLFLIALGLIHPFFLLLVIGLFGIMALVKIVTEFLTSEADKSFAILHGEEKQTLTDANDLKIIAGLQAIALNLAKRFSSMQAKRHEVQDRSAGVIALRGALLGFLRSSAQLLSLALGALLVVNGDLTAGGMIGASIISAKTITILEGCLNNLDDIQATRKAFQNLKSMQDLTGTLPTEVLDLSGALKCEGLIYPRGGGAAPRLDRISFDLNAGECLAIIGDSGSGKTTLLHALSGIDSSPIGSVFLDETEVKTLGFETAQKAIGYLPQQATLLKGTLAENIACFQQAPEDQRIIEAAKITGVHGFISALPQSYQTDMSKHAALLSAGQMQRLALARAIFEAPKYLFLDEPNALLDANGERHLYDTLSQLKQQGTTILMTLHRPGLINLADKVMYLDRGRMADFGPRAEVLSRMNENKQRITLPLRPTSLPDLTDWVTAQFVRASDQDFCQKAVLVATEMFNAACLNGSNNDKREIICTFKFINEKHCEITLHENAKTRATEKMRKIRSLIKHPEVSMIDLSEDEIALAVVAQMTDTLEVRNLKDASIFSAKLSHAPKTLSKTALQ